MLNDLSLLLEFDSKEISMEYEKAKIEGGRTPQEKSDRREKFFRNIMKKYYPFPYRVVKGVIRDSFGNISNSIDCIILNPSHPNTLNDKDELPSIIFADATDYAIEIKSELTNKDEIERALLQIQSVKKLRRVRDGILQKNKCSVEELECAKTIPGIIVAEKTYSDLRKLVDNIVQVYTERHIPRLEQFDLLLINNSYLIYNFRKNSYIKNDYMEGIAYWEGQGLSLALLLYELNVIPKSEPEIGKNVMGIYLNGIRPKNLKTYHELNEKLLQEIY